MAHWIYYACDISEALASVRGAINGFPNLVLSIAPNKPMKQAWGLWSYSKQTEIDK